GWNWLAKLPAHGMGCHWVRWRLHRQFTQPIRLICQLAAWGRLRGKRSLYCGKVFFGFLGGCGLAQLRYFRQEWIVLGFGDRSSATFSKAVNLVKKSIVSIRHVTLVVPYSVLACSPDCSCTSRSNCSYPLPARASSSRECGRATPPSLRPSRFSVRQLRPSPFADHHHISREGHRRHSPFLNIRLWCGRC